jgi:hypothetical protein
VSSSEPEGIEKHRLQAHYSEYRKHRFFAADGLLNQLGAQAWKVVRQESGARKLIASNLATVFCDAAASMEGIPITVERGERWFGLMDGPILRCLDILTGKSVDPTEPALSALAAAYDRVAAEISN